MTLMGPQFLYICPSFLRYLPLPSFCLPSTFPKKTSPSIHYSSRSLHISKTFSDYPLSTTSFRKQSSITNKLSSNMASSSNAPGNMGNWRGRGDWNPRGWGTNVRGRGRGRGGYATGSGGEGSYRSQTAGRRRPLVSLREHAGASIVPLERRHRIYLSGDRPQETSGAVPAGQAPPGDQDQEDTQPSSSSAEGDDGGAQTEAGHATLGGDNVSPGEHLIVSVLFTMLTCIQARQRRLEMTSGMNRHTSRGSETLARMLHLNLL